VSRISDAISPHSRFVCPEHDRLAASARNLAAMRDQLVSLRERVERLR
jgi:ubiquinone biosynthesis protein UbiJ